MEFENLANDDESSYVVNDYNSDELNYEMSHEEVSKAIDAAKNGKAFLEIPNAALKNDNAKLLLSKFFNLCFQSGVSPTGWSFSNIIPIPKPEKDQRDPLQNRCITIICCIAKIYSSILNKRLQKHLENNRILADEQNGFRCSRSCIDHSVLVTFLRNRLALGKETFLTFVDFKKAFDTVDRHMLMFKLIQIGVTGQFYKAIVSLYQNPKSRVILNEYSTEYFECPIGVKQGDTLSPTLFTVYINDLASELRDSMLGIKLENNSGILLEIVSTLLYADDIVLLAENENDLQSMLLILENWCKK